MLQFNATKTNCFNVYLHRNPQIRLNGPESRYNTKFNSRFQTLLDSTEVSVEVHLL